MANQNLLCPLCKSNLLKEENSAGKNYPLKRCSVCKLVFEGIPPQKEESIYDENYYKSKEIKGGYFNYIAESTINKLTFDQRLKKIGEKVTKEARLLDIGCALGDFLEVARDKQWENSFGIEVSDYSIEQCLKKGLKVYKKGSKQEKEILKNNFFDVVVFQDVVEHLKDPVSQIKEINRILKPGAFLFLTTPDIGSLSQKLLGKQWYHFKKGEHLIYFNKSNLKMLLDMGGFTNIKIKPTLSWVTVEYLINRLHYYFPKISQSFVSKIASNLLFKIPFPIYTGEIEAWAYKPK